MFLRDLLAALDAASVDYCLVGGVAVNLHGVPRTTYDVDLVVAPRSNDFAAAERVLADLGLVCRLPLKLVDLADASVRRSLLDERNLIAVTYTDPTDPLREVDVLVNPPIDAERLVSGAVVMTFDGIPVRVISRADLVAMKRASGRAQDLADVAHLERLP